MAYFSSTIAIVGGGASGTLVASNLLRKGENPFRVLLYDDGERLGAGVAYGTPDVAHLLNVPAAKMSAFPERPSHFLDWLNAPSNCASLVQGSRFAPGDFVSRAIYARYLSSVLEESAETGESKHVRFEHRPEKVVDFIPREGGGTLVTKSADTEDVAHIVLALGNLPSRDPLPSHHRFFGSSRYVANPWQAGALENLPVEGDVLVVGSGLTAFDVIASLQRSGHRGKIFVTSRNGRFPQAHAAHAPYPDFLKDIPAARNLRVWLRRIRHEIRDATSRGIDWRPVLDSLRPHTQAIWQGLDLAERRRFLRHVRPFWEGHRHRAPAATWHAVEAMQKNGQLEFFPGRIRDFAEDEHGVRVCLERKHSREKLSLEVAIVLNCIGPESNFRHHLNDPLIINLIARGILHPDPLFLGLDATPDGQLIGADGVIYPQISTLGPPLRGVLWETTAIPEIRVQAESLAARILRGFHVPAWQI